MTRVVPILCTIGLLGMAVSSGVAQDFDGDGRDDIAVYHPAAGRWYVLASTDARLQQTDFGFDEAVPVHGDFDGDGRFDRAVYTPADGMWSWLRSGDGQFAQQQWGARDLQPVTGDYDGDGITDVAVYQRQSATWFIRESTSGSLRTFVFGWSDVRPVPADYDGDGRTDPAVYHRASGTWSVLGSTGGFRSQQFGYPAARPVPADYDGDGAADLAVYDRSSGTWYILGSTDGFRSEQFGYALTRAVPLDHDGDGRADLAVYERPTGTWYLLQSSDGFTTRNWGWPDAVPLPAYRDGGGAGLTVLAFGNSITHGTSSACNCPDTGYPALLERKLRAVLGGHTTILNAGVPGETTGQGRARFPAWFDAVNPDLVLLMEGTNDTFFNVPFTTIEANLRAMIDYAVSRNADVVLATIPPVISNQFRNRNDQAARIRAFNPRIPGIAASFGLTVAPVYAALTAQPGWETALMDQPTANHPNDAGYRVVRDTFLQAVLDRELSGRLW